MPVKKLHFISDTQRNREENLFLRVYNGEATPADLAELPKSMMPTIQFCKTMASFQRQRGNQHELPLGEIIVHNAELSRVTDTPFIDPDPIPKNLEPLSRETVLTQKEISQPTPRKRR